MNVEKLPDDPKFVAFAEAVLAIRRYERAVSQSATHTQEQP